MSAGLSNHTVDEVHEQLLKVEERMLVVIESMKKIDKRLKVLESIAEEHGLLEKDGCSDVDDRDICSIC